MRTQILLLLSLVVAVTLVHSESGDGDYVKEAQGLSSLYLL